MEKSDLISGLVEAQCKSLEKKIKKNVTLDWKMV